MDQGKDHKKSLLDQWLSSQPQQKPKRIEPKPKEVPAALSLGQRRLWFLQKLYPTNSFYHYVDSFRFKGPLNPILLHQSLKAVLHRHHNFRTCLKEVDGQITPTLLDQVNLNEQIFPPTSEPIETVFQKAYAFARSPFDLENGNGVNYFFHPIAENDFLVVLSIHHLYIDEWSMRLLIQEWSTHYQALVRGESPAPEPVSLQYADFAYWESQQPIPKTSLDYWLNQLNGSNATIQIPTDFIRTTPPTYRGHYYGRDLKEALTTPIRQLAQVNGTTLFVLLLSAFKVLLYRYSGQTDINIGSPFSNRDQIEFEKIVGFFNNTLVLRSKLTGKQSFIDLLQSVTQTVLDAFSHKTVPFETIVSEMHSNRNSHQNPLFQVMFLYNKAEAIPPFASGVEMEQEHFDFGVAKFDLTLLVNEKPDVFNVLFEYTSDLFQVDRIDRMISHLEVLLESIVENPRQSIDQLEFIPKAERQQILSYSNNSNYSIPRFKNVLAYFEEQVQTKPHQIAVQYQDQYLSYQQLNQEAEKIAANIQQANPAKGQQIGLFIDRSIYLMTGILGALKAGAAYVPLDPEYPRDRITYMIEDAGLLLILTRSTLLETLPEASIPVLDIENLQTGPVYHPQEIEPSDLAYIIYTSGSTGKPKGVQITHENLIYSTVSRFHFYANNPTAFLLLSSFAFDSSVAGIFWTLTTGGKLVISTPRIEQDIEAFAKLFSESEISHTLLLPSLYYVLLQHGRLDQLSSLHTVIVAGEACSKKLVQRHFDCLPDVQLYNEYGPTESTVWSTAHKISLDDIKEGSIPIGRPIPYYQNFIVDSSQNILPVGVPGELLVAGPGVSLGYINRSQLTSEKFISLQLGNESINTYRTGDLAQWTPKGQIEFLGRADHQIKIRGFRVELDEIKTAILDTKLAEDAIVIAHKENEASNYQLLAYLIQNEKQIEISTLRKALNGRLPHYMVPAAFVQLDRFPTLPNGKIDIQALPKADLQSAPSTDYVAPQTSTQQQLAEIWGVVLQQAKISIQDNFFEIGGDSILSIQIVAEAQKRGLSLSPTAIFDYQTIAELAEVTQTDDDSFIDVASWHNPFLATDFPQLPEVGIKEVYPLSFLQKALLFHHLQTTEDQGFLQLEFWLQCESTLEIQTLETAWDQVIYNHPILRTGIFWEGLEEPVQAVFMDASKINISFENWTVHQGTEQQEKIKTLLLEDKAHPLALNEAPVMRIRLIQLTSNTYYLLWTCHHILLDGWSAGIILQEVLNNYEKIISNEPLPVQVKPSYGAFLNWVTQQDHSKAKIYWRRKFKGFQRPQAFGGLLTQSKPNYLDYTFTIESTQLNTLTQFIQNNRLTLNTLIQGVWAIALQQYFETKDIVYGVTVTGRFSKFPQIESMSGLFMNVIPVRIYTDSDLGIAHWLNQLQGELQESRAYERSSMDDINRWIEWDRPQEIFDSLLVFGNFLMDRNEARRIQIQEFRGGFTSTYPLTIRVKPTESLQFDFRYDSRVLETPTIQWFEQQIKTLFASIIAQPETTLDQLIQQLDTPPETIQKPATTQLASSEANNYIAPRNETELELVRIWENLLNRRPIGIQDNFFEIGGKSTLALKLFSKLETELGVRLAPVTLLENPTVEKLALQIQADDLPDSWSSLVPLRKEGKELPLFCVHAGGGHVFFYEPLTHHLGADQPVYALQPVGLDGETAFHQSMEEMAAHYIREIQSVQPHGPYALLGTCFSNQVIYEMTAQLNQMDEEVRLLLMIDSGPGSMIPVEPEPDTSRVGLLFKSIQRGDWKRIYKKIKGSLVILQTKLRYRQQQNQQNDLDHFQDALTLISVKYQASPYTNGKITLIRSTEFDQRSDKDRQIKRWSYLAKGGLDVHVVPGHHISLFEEPEVQGLAKKISECLADSRPKS